MPGWTPKWVLTPRADDSVGPVSPVSRWSTIAPSAGIQRSCDRWQLAERCPGHSQRCPCSMCAQASGCRRKWTAPGCPSSWTSTEGPHRWVRLGSASLFSGSKVASISRLGQVRGADGKGHTDLSAPPRQWWGVLSSARCVGPSAKHLDSEGQGGEGRRTGAWSSQTPTLSSLCRSNSNPGLILPSLPTHRAATTHGHILPSDSSSCPSGPQAWNKQRDEDGMGWDEGVWDQVAQNKTCCSAHLLLYLPLSSLLPSPHCPCFPFCLGGALRGSQELPPCPLDSWHLAVSQIL